MSKNKQPAVWFLAIRCNSGTDVFTERLCAGLNKVGVRAVITWLPHRAEYAPWSVSIPKPPTWATIVHVNTWLPPRFIPNQLPVVATIHHSTFDPLFKPFKTFSQKLYHNLRMFSIEQQCLRAAKRIVAVSHYAAQQAQSAFKIKNIDVIHNGINDQQFNFIPRNIAHYPFRLLYVGNWSVLKGVELFYPIMQQLGKDFVLYYTSDRQNRHQRYKLPTNSINLGRLSYKDLVNAYQTADALLFPSRLEGFGLVVAEAMACGLPAITSDCSALSELVEHEKTGFLCPPNNVNAFVSAASTLANHKQLWCNMQYASRARIVAQFSEAKMINQYIELYKEVVA